MIARASPQDRALDPIQVVVVGFLLGAGQGTDQLPIQV